MTPVCIAINWIKVRFFSSSLWLVITLYLLTSFQIIIDSSIPQYDANKTHDKIDKALTSYFCLLSFSQRSNFSASSSIIHCHSSLAFSLWNQATHSDIRHFLNLIWELNMPPSESLHVPERVRGQRLTSIYPQTDGRCWVASFFQPGSFSSSPSQSVSLPLYDPPSVRKKCQNKLHRLLQSEKIWHQFNIKSIRWWKGQELKRDENNKGIIGWATYIMA